MMKRKINSINPNYNKYAEYIYEHVINVLRSWNEILKPNLLKSDIDERNLDAVDDIIGHHDESKYSKEEWDAYLNHFYPSEGYLDDKEAFDRAWLHHQHNNPHHWQHWVLVRDEGNILPLDMPFEYICEMLCDWHSFSAKDKHNTAINWYNENGDKMILSENTRNIIENLIEYLSEPLK